MHKLKKLAKIKAKIKGPLFSWLFLCIKPYLLKLGFLTLLTTLHALSPVAEAILLKVVIDAAVAEQIDVALLYGGGLILVFILQLLLSAVVPIYETRVQEQMTNKLQFDFMKKYYQTDWLQLNRYHTGDILTRMDEDIHYVVNGAVNLLPETIALAIQLVAAISTLLFFDPIFALIAVLVGPLTLVFGLLIGQKLMAIQHVIQESESKYLSFITEAISNILIIKAFGHEKASINQMAGLQKTKYAQIIGRTKISAVAETILGSGFRFAFIITFVIGIYKLSKKLTTFGTFSAFLTLVAQVQAPFMVLAQSLAEFFSVLTSAERLIEIENLQSEGETASLLPTAHAHGLIVNELSFSYTPEQPILNTLSLNIAPGSFCAIVGASGAGKTTFMRLMLALIQPQAGTLSVYAHNNAPTPISSNTRSFFTYVPQGNTLFSGTIAENLRLGNPLATEAELIHALIAAAAWSFVQDVPDGLQALIGEHGIGISEGQAQRLAIARAILRKAPIILLDEATSALDLATEEAVLFNLKQLTPARTCIAITHRQSVLSLCDQVFPLVDGSIKK